MALAEQSEVRLAELVATLSLGTDLGLGQPMEHVIRQALHRSGGLDAAVAVARERSGTHFDPARVELFCDQATVLLSDLDAASSWNTVIAAEPQLGVALG